MFEKTREQMLNPAQHETVVAEGVSFEEFLTEFGEVHAEWVMGKVIIVTNNMQHQRIMGFLYKLFGYFLEFKLLGEVFLAGVPMKIPGQPGREPDLLLVLNEHRSRLKVNHVDGAADIVVEIVSPESATRDRVDKVAEYARAGVPEYWLVDPLLKAATVHVLGADGKYVVAPLNAEGELVSRVLPGFRLNPALLWQEELPNGAAVVEMVRGMAG